MESIEKCRDFVDKKEVVVEEEMKLGLRKGAWTFEEDSKLIGCISIHGPAQWSYLARSAGLERSGKSCRLRWLNYLRPGVKRGNFTLQEQILILELQSRWGNRWSKIAQGLPGRTDNEIKNYWRTRVQKLANQLNCQVNSTQFRDTLSYIWLPRLRERVQEATVSAQYSSMVVQPTNTTSTDVHTAACNNTTAGAGYGLPLDSNCTEFGTTPEEAIYHQVSPASDLTTYGDRHGDVLVSSSNWWEYIREGSIYTDQLSTSTALSTGYYSEQEEGYWFRIYEETNRWLGDGGGDLFQYSRNDDM